MFTNSEKQRKLHEFEEHLLRNVTKNCDRYYKVRQNLLQSVTVMIKCENYWKMRRSTGIYNQRYCKYKNSEWLYKQEIILSFISNLHNHNITNDTFIIHPEILGSLFVSNILCLLTCLLAFFLTYLLT